MRKLVIVDPSKLDYVKSKGRSSPTKGDCGEIDDVRGFVWHAARLTAELGIINQVNPDLLVTFAMILKSKNEEEIICRMSKYLANRKSKRRKNIKTSGSRRKGSTRKKARKSSGH